MITDTYECVCVCVSYVVMAVNLHIYYNYSVICYLLVACRAKLCFLQLEFCFMFGSR